MKYRKGVKYPCAEDYTIEVSIRGYLFEDKFLKLTVDGLLTIKEGYACDGPSGPAIDSPQLMGAAFVHDALYELFRRGMLPIKYRFEADMIFQKLAIEAGRVLAADFRKSRKLWIFTSFVAMLYSCWCRFRAWYCYSAVTLFAASAADPKNRRQIIVVP